MTWADALLIPGLGRIGDGDAERRDRPPRHAERGRRGADPRERLEGRGAQIHRCLAAHLPFPPHGGVAPRRLEELPARADEFFRAGTDPLRVAGEHDAVGRDVVQEQLHPVRQHGRERLHAFDGYPLGQLAENVGQGRVGVGEFLGPMFDRRGEQQLAARRRPKTALGRADAALVGDLEVTDLLDRVAEELDPQRVFLGGREHVDDAAPHRDLAAAPDHVGPGVADLDQPGEQVVEFVRLADLQRDRLEVAEAGHDRLQQAPDRRHHDRQRPVRLAVGRRVREPPEHGDPLPHGVRPRR